MFKKSKIQQAEFNPSQMKISPIKVSSGLPTPFGSKIFKNGINFAIFSNQAKKVTLALFQKGSKKPFYEIILDNHIHKTGDIWHIFLEVDEYLLENQAWLYAYQIDDSKYLLDPFAKKIFIDKSENFQLFGGLSKELSFDWEGTRKPKIPMNELIIYEMHVRGFTFDPSSHVKEKGTFLGIIEKIPYLKSLHINAIELLPIQEFNHEEYKGINPENGRQLCNYWGYSTLNFFSIKELYSSGKDSLFEFKTLVRELHKEGIEIILDVVFNHTGEGNSLGPTLSFKGIDNAVYYLLDENSDYYNFSGCGNTLNCNHPVVAQLILEVLRYFVVEAQVDGFRFDLASILNRDTSGHPTKQAPLIEFISKDPLLSDIKLIAEPWDAAGFYQVGSFYPDEIRWSEWNGRYRDDVRYFLNGIRKDPSKFATRISGSQDLYFKRAPFTSINFITSHDGFTLHDLVCYNEKHNLPNGEENRDGNNHNISSNFGVEGETTNAEIITLRERQMRNYHFVLMISQGVPLISMGDEYGHTKKGNNNSWCQDNEINWFQWDLLEKKSDFHRFYKKMIEFRKMHPFFKRDSFLTDQDIVWHGIMPFQPKFGQNSSFIAFTLNGKEPLENIYIAINPSNDEVQISLPLPPLSTFWCLVVYTANEPPYDFIDEKQVSRDVIKEKTFKMKAHSCLLLKSYLLKTEESA